MSEEQGFLDQLAALPGDDVTRAVYADWLEERGDSRAAFLRAELALAALDASDPSYATREQELAELGKSVPADWVRDAGKRWDVWLAGYIPPMKIPVIKVLRETTGCALAEGKTISENLPARVLASCSRIHATTVRGKFEACPSWITHPGQPPHVHVSLRPCPDPSFFPRVPPASGGTLVLLKSRPGQESNLVAALKGMFNWGDHYAGQVGTSDRPLHLGRFPQEQAETLAAQLREFAEIEIHQADVPLPTFAPFTGTGPFDVRLMSYPPAQKIAVIKAYRELTPVGLAEAKSWAEGTPPLTIIKAADALTAERVRRMFADMGEVMVGDATPV